PLPGILAHRLQQPIPRLFIFLLIHDQALVYQGGEEVEDLPVFEGCRVSGVGCRIFAGYWVLGVRYWASTCFDVFSDTRPPIPNTRTYRFRRFQRPAAGKDGEAAEQRFFLRVEQIVAPVDQRP